ncbi:MAG: hypothetical protein HQL75_05760 [Magnetococcales bacterium]|nr:hypothetical protein [Magnetococcales bacterium]
MKALRGCGGRWGKGLAMVLGLGMALSTATPVYAAPGDAAIVLVGLILGGARNVGGHHKVMVPRGAVQTAERDRISVPDCGRSGVSPCGYP